MLSSFLIWLTICLLFFIVELTGIGMFFFLSFSIGALMSAITCFWVPCLFWQALIFLGSSAVAVALLKFLVHPERFMHHATNAERLVGMHGLVVKAVTHELPGQVKVHGQIWSARSIDPQVLPAGTMVEIVRVQGSHVIVKRAH